MLLSVLLALTVIMLTARAVGYLFSKINQPAVIGEVVGGILLGPSLLGRIAPEAQAVMLPPDAAPILGVISQLGVILYMFLVGLELDLGVLRGTITSTVVIALSAIVVPFALGTMLALGLHETLAPAGIDRASFVLFIGVALSMMFLPAFFAFTGLRTEIGLIQSGEDWALCGLIVAVATAGKFGGTAIAARLSGMPWRDSAALGALMNTRGLVELIVLNIGLDLGVMSPRLFTMLVIMALVTTMMTSPILTALLNDRRTAVARP